MPWEARRLEVQTKYPAAASAAASFFDERGLEGAKRSGNERGGGTERGSEGRQAAKRDRGVVAEDTDAPDAPVVDSSLLSGEPSSGESSSSSPLPSSEHTVRLPFRRIPVAAEDASSQFGVQTTVFKFAAVLPASTASSAAIPASTSEPQASPPASSHPSAPALSTSSSGASTSNSSTSSSLPLPAASSSPSSPTIDSNLPSDSPAQPTPLLPSPALSASLSEAELSDGMKHFTDLSFAVVSQHVSAVTQWTERNLTNAKIDGQMVSTTQDRSALGALFDFIQIGGVVDGEVVVRLMQNALLSNWRGPMLTGAGDSSTATKLVADVFDRVRAALNAHAAAFDGGEPRQAAGIGAAPSTNASTTAATDAPSSAGGSGGSAAPSAPSDATVATTSSPATSPAASDESEGGAEDIWDSFRPGRVLLEEAKFIDALMTLRDTSLPANLDH